MSSYTETTLRSHALFPVAYLARVVLACVALASCSGGPGAVHPDLVVTDPAVSDDRPVAGASFTFSATVRNAGGGTAAATTLRIRRSDDVTVTHSDEHVGAAAVAALTASASVDTPVELSAPPSPGTYHYGACVDAVPGESDTANNCSAPVQVIIRPGAPDPAPDPPLPNLVVEGPSVSAGSPGAGASFTFSATVRNAGDGDAAATTLRVYRSEDATIALSDTHVDTIAVPPLAASDSIDSHGNLTAPSSPGTYYYGACVDAVPGKSDTAHNCSVAVTVTVPAPPPVPRPDLVVAMSEPTHDNPAGGGFFAWIATVRNDGDGTAAATAVRIHRSDSATFENPHVRTSFSVPALDASTQLPEMADVVKTPADMGTYYYRACVDPVPGESNTTNNCSAALKIEITHSDPNLFMDGAIWPQVVHTGASFQLIAKVWSLGAAPSATTMRFYLLPDKESAPTSGTEVGTVAVPALDSALERTSPAAFVGGLELTAPLSGGVYYYVACVDLVTDESDTTDNCSTLFDITVVLLL